LTFFVTVSLFAAYEAVAGQRFRRLWWLVSAVFCGLGVLTKGPIAMVLLAPPVVADIWLRRGQVRPALVHWLGYGGIVLAMVAPWFVAISIKDPQFLYEFFVKHNLVRFIGGGNY